MHKTGAQSTSFQIFKMIEGQPIDGPKLSKLQPDCTILFI